MKVLCCVMNCGSHAKDFFYVVPVKFSREETVTKGQKDQVHIPPEGSRAKVCQIQAKLGRQNALAVKSVWIRGRPQDLLFIAVQQCRQIRNSRPDLQDRLPKWTVELHILRYFGAWTDQAHVALEYVVKLGQFIELEFPQPGPDARDAAVSRRGYGP